MKNYEGLFILRPDLADEEVKDLYQKIQANLKKYNGEIENAEEWGKKRLAYKIGRHREGFYYLLRFKIEPGQIVSLNNDFKLNESIVRGMITER